MVAVMADAMSFYLYADNGCTRGPWAFGSFTLGAAGINRGDRRENIFVVDEYLIGCIQVLRVQNP
jgi:hypothetical protein